MLGFRNKMFGPKANPIGVDFGTDTLRLVQVTESEGEVGLLAAASTDVPSHIRNDAPARLAFFSTTIRELMNGGAFKGRQAVLGLPSSRVSMVHLRVPPLEDEALKKVIPQEARGKLPYDPSHAVIRHLVAGEVYQGPDRKLEAIVLASPRNQVELFLAAAAKAKLDVVGVNVEPLAMIDCFARLARRREDREMTMMYIDIGASGTRAVIAKRGKVMFARSIPIGGDTFTQSVAQMGQIGFEDARLMRLRLAENSAAPALADTPRTSDDDLTPATPPKGAEEVNSFALLGAAQAKKTGVLANVPAPSMARQGGATGIAMQRVESAVREPLGRLVAELDMCRKYHDATFQGEPVEKLIFVGGEANQRELCACIAKSLGLAASVGDPLARVKRPAEGLGDTGLDRRIAFPGWAVALGLSMGPQTKAEAA